MLNTRRVVLVCLCVLAFTGCGLGSGLRKGADSKGLTLGVAVQAGDVLDKKSAALVTGDFNLIVPENTMKWSIIRPKKDFWNWSDMDAMVAFAERHNIRMKGHAFVWHQQNPPYVNALKTREEAVALLTEQITEVMTRYKGRIAEYDVANEVIADDGSLRDTIWLKTIGPDYLDIAFAAARAADPDAKLILNDYSNEYEGQTKADAFYDLVAEMKGRGVPIDAVGFQLHLEAKHPVNVEALRSNVRRFAELGVGVSFTEIDVRVQIPPTDERVAEQDAVYGSLLDVALTEPNVTGFIMWGYTDLRSWIPQFFAGYGYGHIYDRQMKKKSAYQVLKDRLSR